MVVASNEIAELIDACFDQFNAVVYLCLDSCTGSRSTTSIISSSAIEEYGSPISSEGVITLQWKVHVLTSSDFLGLVMRIFRQCGLAIYWSMK